MSRNITRLSRLSAWAVAASAGVLAGNVRADEVSRSAAPRPTPPPLQPTPLVPDPVKLGGFHPKTDPAPGVFLQEGSFVFERPARFVVEADGKALLQFGPEAQLEDPKPADTRPAGTKPPDTKPADTKPAEAKPAAKVPPVYVLPNLKRMAIEDALKGRSLPLIVSGTATEFDGRNYLLLDDDTRPAGPPATAPAKPPDPADPATRPATPVKNLSSDQLLSQLLRPAPGSSAAGSAAGSPGSPAPAPLRWDKPAEADKTSGGGAVKPGAPTVTLKREGHYLTDRIGRLARGADGKATEFVIESDGKALRDPPLIVMPCGKLYIMQATVVAVGRDVRFRLSGTVTEYRGRNYILPEKVVLMPDVVQSF